VNGRVFVLMAGLTALFVAVGGSVGGQQGAVMALLLAGVSNFVMYYRSSSLALRAYRAQVLGPDEAHELRDVVDGLRQRAGLPMPTLAIAPHAQPNAFATGRNADDAVVCVTQGLLQLVSRDELEGVLAHELGHVRNRDMLLQTFTATLAGAVGFLAQMGMMSGGRRTQDGGRAGNPLVFLLAPLAASVIQMAISRQREFAADRAGAEISGKPLALASALRKLDAAARQVPMKVAPTYAPLAQVNPLAAMPSGLARLFTTHPSTEERVARLEAMAAGQAQP
jgi:heat shock protein HtpX